MKTRVAAIQMVSAAEVSANLAAAERLIALSKSNHELTARAEGTAAAGDAPLERGYSAVLAAARAGSGSASAVA